MLLNYSSCCAGYKTVCPAYTDLQKQYPLSHYHWLKNYHRLPIHFPEESLRPPYVDKKRRRVKNVNRPLHLTVLWRKCFNLLNSSTVGSFHIRINSVNELKYEHADRVFLPACFLYMYLYKSVCRILFRSSGREYARDAAAWQSWND